MMTGDRCVVGVDFGTLSGRAVVVRVDDGAELGSAVHEYRHGVLERRLDVGGRPGPSYRRTGRRRYRTTMSRSSSTPYPPPSARAASTRPA
jgi:ribulose kinase